MQCNTGMDISEVLYFLLDLHDLQLLFMIFGIVLASDFSMQWVIPSFLAAFSCGSRKVGVFVESDHQWDIDLFSPEGQRAKSRTLLTPSVLHSS